MYRRGLGDFKYFVGVGSLAQVATREDRVCVLNILGGESSGVTPVSHAYSGGNVVFGTSVTSLSITTCSRDSTTAIVSIAV
jgi:nitroimidazol reductase NimA-like FMN-containing flavoprotein (pyridoxamine 5'-phosphate oxidase superfamily)